ncbi:MAG: Wzz/FepE/Etk N-terminal domain-containing protein [Solirubrobacteraceae bacterium]
MSATRPTEVQEQRGAARSDAPWVVPGGESHGLVSYLEAIRYGRWIVVGALVACLGASLLYLAQATKVYEASADILITAQRELPVPISGIIVQTSDPTRDVETVARLVTSPSVTRRVIEALELDRSVSDVVDDVSAQPLAQSNIVTITAEGATPEEAKQLADAFGREFVDDRTDRLHAELDEQIAQLEPQVRDKPTAAELANPASTAAQLGTLRQLRLGDDPSVSFESAAELPESAASPRPVLTLGAAIIGGLVIGLVGAFSLQLLDPRLRREEQLRASFRLPILARIPLERRRKARPLLPSELSLGALDGYQALRAAITTTRRDSLSGRVVLVTGASPGDGKSTAAINLASTIAAAGKRVILIEADSRRPSIGRALDLRAEVGLASVVTGRRYLVDALIPVGGEDAKLRVLLNSADEAPAADVLSRLSADTLLLQAQRLADWVIVDSPPLNHVAETLALAQVVDDLLVVVRIGKTNFRDLTELAEMLAQQDIMPAGFVVLGGHARTAYY